MHHQGYVKSNAKNFNQLSSVPEEIAAVADCYRSPQRSLLCNHRYGHLSTRTTGIPSYKAYTTLPQTNNTLGRRFNFQQYTNSNTDSDIDSGSFAAPQRVRTKKRRRHTLSDVQRAMMQTSHVSSETSDCEATPPYGYSTLHRDWRVGAISHAEAERKRVAFLRYLEHRSPHQADAIMIKTSQPDTFSEVQDQSSYVADIAYYSSSGEYEVPAGESLNRGGRFRSSLPIVRTRSRSRERPLGVIYLEYSGQSRAVLLPNELTSLDTIRALFVQAYPGLLTMPMLNPQRHTLLLKNKKSGDLEEIDNISRIKDRSTVRARPTGIPTPNKKPAVQQKPKLGRNNLQKIEDRAVAEKNQKNQQKSGLKAPVKSLIRQYQNGAKVPENNTATDGNNPRTIPKSNDTTQKSFKGKAPPPPPRTPKPSAAASTPKPTTNLNVPGPNSNGNSKPAVGLGGGSVLHKGFSYVPSGFPPKKEAKPIPDSNLKLPSSLSSSQPNKELSSFGYSSDNHDSDSGTSSSKSPPMQPRTYAGSSMASQTKFSSVSQGELNIPKLLKPKSYEHRTRTASQGSKPTSPISTASDVSTEGICRGRAASERKESSPASNSPLYGLSSRSYRGHQPKPFSIPIVPDVTNLRSANNAESASQATNQLAERAVSQKPKPQSPAGTSQSSETLASSDGSLEKKKTSNSKKGLFGLRKLVSNRNSTNSKLNSKRTQSLEAPSSNLAEDSIQPNTPFAAPNSSNTPVRSASFSETTPSSEIPQVPKKNEVKSSNVSSRKATIPKTDLLHSLLNHKTDSSEKATDRRISHSPPSSIYSDSDKEATTGPSGLTGVLKNSNLVKSNSASSILTDSGASNLSATPSVKLKKVSFQDNVTVCDGNSISTFSNSLRHPDYDDREPVGPIESQSLSHDVTEGQLTRECAIVRPWQPETPLADQPSILPKAPGYMQYQSNAYPPSFTSFATHQSAVAAAIETISAKAAMTSQYKPITSAPQIHTRFEQFGVSCASPVPQITLQDRARSVQKEEWTPARGPADPTSIPQGLATMQSHPVITADSLPLHDSSRLIGKSYTPEYIKEPEVPYLQTQGHPVTKDPYHSDTPPYYECCVPAQVTPSQLNQALDQRHNNAKDLANEATRNLPAAPAVTQNVPPVAPKLEKSNNRTMAIERQLTNLTGTVEPIITTDKSPLSPPSGATQYPRHTTGSAVTPYSDTATFKTRQPDTRDQLLKLRKTAQTLKKEIKELKKQQRCNMENMNEMVAQKAKDVAQFIASTAGAEQRPLRLRRMRLDQQRHTYGKSASNTEKQLSDVEAGVEELRNEVVERRCRVNAREVEALVLQLSQAGRTIAKLKGSFPSLCDEIRTVAAAETEVIYAEEKFAEAEPQRLDEQLKRCKQLTATLFTLKKLANVQEARSKTPTPSVRATTPCPMTSLGDDPILNKRRVLNDVRRLRVDHHRRMDSIQALEIAEKALNRTDHVSQIDERRRAQLVELYNNRTAPNTNLTTSESSSIESLPPPPPPSERINSEYPKGHSAYPYAAPSNAMRQPPTDLKMARSTSGFGYGVVSPDVGYISSEQSPDTGRIALPPGNTGSLPRYSGSSGYRLGYGNQGSGRSNPNLNRHPDGFQSGKPMERSRSVTPQHWNSGGLEIAPYQMEPNRASQMSNEERQQILMKQKSAFVEKNRKLKDQYSKLQQMQMRQRMSIKKPPPSKMSSPGGFHHHNVPMKSGAKSSDV